jgi:hypothetical protein
MTRCSWSRCCSMPSVSARCSTSSLTGLSRSRSADEKDAGSASYSTAGGLATRPSRCGRQALTLAGGIMDAMRGRRRSGYDDAGRGHGRRRAVRCGAVRCGALQCVALRGGTGRTSHVQTNPRRDYAAIKAKAARPNTKSGSACVHLIARRSAPPIVQLY